MNELVIYHVITSMTMKDALVNKSALNDWEYRYQLINLQELSAKDYLHYDEPENLILALLMKHESPGALIQEILEKIKQLLPKEELKKALLIAELLIQNRKGLTDVFIKKVNEMNLEYDMRKMPSYIEGKKEGSIENIIMILENRFKVDLCNNTIKEKVKQIDNGTQLDKLVIKAATVGTLEEFEKLLE